MVMRHPQPPTLLRGSGGPGNFPSPPPPGAQIRADPGHQPSLGRARAVGRQISSEGRPGPQALAPGPRRRVLDEPADRDPRATPPLANSQPLHLPAAAPLPGRRQGLSLSATLAGPASLTATLTVCRPDVLTFLSGPSSRASTLTRPVPPRGTFYVSSFVSASPSLESFSSWVSFPSSQVRPRWFHLWF